MIFINASDQLGQFIQPLMCFGRNENDRCVAEILKFVSDMTFKFLHRIAVFFERIPFIDDNYDSATGIVRIACDVLILFTNSFFGIQHDANDIGTINCLHCPQDGIFFRIFINFALLANSSSVNHRVN